MIRVTVMDRFSRGRRLPGRRRARGALAWTAALSASVACGAESVLREQAPLNGEWELALTRSADIPSSTSAWQKVEVPYLRTGYAIGGSEFAWFRRTIRIPEAWTGRRVFVYVGGARFHPRVFVDETCVAERVDGWTPFEVELTPSATPGRDVRILLCCQDWGATFADGFVLAPGTRTEWRGLRGAPKGKVIAPIGGHSFLYGPWDDLFLVSRPPIHLDDVAIQTSVRNGTLTVRGGGSGLTKEHWVEGVVMDGRDAVLRLGPAPADGNGRWVLTAPFPKPHLWSPEHPHLYRLKLALRPARDGQIVDVHEERFGFRELWTEGPDFLLNGVRRHLLATSGWPAEADQTDDEVREALRAIKAGNAVAFRLHTQPWQKKWLTLADELGLLIVEEGALWCDGPGAYAYADPRFWENTLDHLAGMVRRDRNHASLVMWSVENEILHCGAARFDPDAESGLAKLGRFVKQLDPTHLITFEADLDPGGVADVIGLHYPHEMPEHTDYPNTADWLGRVDAAAPAGAGRAGFRWSRNKPLYIGEYLWVPRQDGAAGAAFFGDSAYTNRAGSHVRAKAKAWEYQTLAYRRAGVSGLCPWTVLRAGGQVDARREVLYETQKRVFEPVAAFVREADSRFYSGETVSRTFDLFNDGEEHGRFVLKWTLGGGLSGQTVQASLPAGGHRSVVVTVKMPAVTNRTRLAFASALHADEREAHTAVRPIDVYPKIVAHLPDGLRLLVYDPHRACLPHVAPLPHQRLSSLSELVVTQAQSSILIVGPNALAGDPGTNRPAAADAGDHGADRLQSFAAAGGRVLLMEQESPQSYPFGLRLVKRASTMTFPLAVQHPLLAELDPEDLKFWRGDHYVTRHEVVRPDRGGAVSLLVSGGENGLDCSPLLERAAGHGRVVFAQALIGARFGVEPAAATLFRNALAYLATARAPATGPALLLAEEPSFVDRVRELGVGVRSAPGAVSTNDLADVWLVLIHGGGNRIARSLPALCAFLSQGQSRVVYWHAPEAGLFSRLAQGAGLGPFTAVAAQGPVEVREPRHPLLNGISREDLAFVVRPDGNSGERGFDPDPSVIDRCLGPDGPAADVLRIEAETMELTGKVVRVSRDGKSVVFASNGEGGSTVEIAGAGPRRLTLRAGGTTADGAYPVARLAIAGRLAADILLTASNVAPYTVMADVPGGTVRVSVAFVNDRCTPDQDRNLILDAVLIERRPFRGIRPRDLTVPPALALLEIPVRDGADSAPNRLLFDGVRWDANEPNTRRARRYASALFANLGAGFDLAGGP